MTIAHAESYIHVFLEALAIAAGVSVDQITVSFTTSDSGDDDDDASSRRRRRLEDAVNVHYVITSETSASSSVYDAMDDLDAAEYDQDLQTAAATSGDQGAFSSVTTAYVSDPASQALNPGSGGGGGGGSGSDDDEDVAVLAGSLSAAFALLLVAGVGAAYYFGFREPDAYTESARKAVAANPLPKDVEKGRTPSVSEGVEMQDVFRSTQHNSGAPTPAHNPIHAAAFAEDAVAAAYGARPGAAAAESGADADGAADPETAKPAADAAAAETAEPETINIDEFEDDPALYG